MPDPTAFFLESLGPVDDRPVVPPNRRSVEVDLAEAEPEGDVPDEVLLAEAESIYERELNRTTSGDATTSTDVLAFYAPYSYYGGNWGIYFVETALWGASRRFARELGEGQNWGHFFRLVRSVEVHELFHFRVEWAAALASSATGSPSHFSAYNRGEWSLDRLLVEREEALATAEQIRVSRRVDLPVADFLAAGVSGLRGYGSYGDYLDPDPVIEGASIQDGLGGIAGDLIQSTAASVLLDQSFSVTAEALVPRYLLCSEISGLSQPFRVHPLKRSEVIRHAQRCGYCEVIDGGKHQVKVRNQRTNDVVPLSSYEDLPHHVVKQLACLHRMSTTDYRAAVLDR